MKHLLLAPFLLGFISPVSAEDFFNQYVKASFIGEIRLICIANKKGYLDQFQTGEMFKESINFFLKAYEGNTDDAENELVKLTKDQFDKSLILRNSPKCKDAFIQMAQIQVFHD